MYFGTAVNNLSYIGYLLMSTLDQILTARQYLSQAARLAYYLLALTSETLKT